jgi:hypothetical protein
MQSEIRDNAECHKLTKKLQLAKWSQAHVETSRISAMSCITLIQNYTYVVKKRAFLLLNTF